MPAEGGKQDEAFLLRLPCFCFIAFGLPALLRFYPCCAKELHI
jgi:hypothetical protein